MSGENEFAGNIKTSSKSRGSKMLYVSVTSRVLLSRFAKLLNVPVVKRRGPEKSTTSPIMSNVIFSTETLYLRVFARTSARMSSNHSSSDSNPAAMLLRQDSDLLVPDDLPVVEEEPSYVHFAEAP